MSATPNMTLLLNQCEAVIDCGAGTLEELRKTLRKSPQQISAWLRGRTSTPNGESAMLIFRWVSDKTLGISAAGPKWQNKYKNAFAEVSKQHPVNKED